MANNTTLRDGNGALFTAESVDVGSGVQRTSMAANLRVANTDVATGNPVPIADAGGAPITGAAMPAGGVGLTGWLSAIWSKLGSVVLAAGTAVIGKVGIQVGGADVASGNPVPIADAGGAPVTGSAMPAGGVGLTGWLSAIWLKLGSVVLAAGTAVIGKVGIDQTSPGTTNAVFDTQSAPVAGVVAITPSDSATLTAGRGLAVIATVAGNVTVAFADGSSIAVPVGIGYQQFPFAVTKLMATGTTATATYANLK